MCFGFGLVLGFVFSFQLHLTKPTNLWVAQYVLYHNAACSVPSKVHLLRYTKNSGKQMGATPLPSPPSASRGREKPLAGCDLGDGRSVSSFWGKQSCSLCSGRLLCFLLSHRNQLGGAAGLVTHHQATGESVTPRSSAGGKHWEYKLEPRSFPGVISL